MSGALTSLGPLARLLASLKRVGYGGAAVLGLLVWSGSRGVATAQEMDAPVAIQVSILSRLLEFDRNFKSHAGEEIVIGIIYQSRFRASANAKAQVVEALNQATFEHMVSLPVRFVLIEVQEATSFRRLVADSDPDLLYITPLRAFAIDSITAYSREAGVLTYTGVSEYVHAGIATGLGIQSGKPKILVNRRAAQQEGAAFSSELLKLAQLVGS